jgi:hypothetical protein
VGRGRGSSVGMIMVQFEDSLIERLEVEFSIMSLFRENYLWKEKKLMNYDPILWYCTTDSPENYCTRLGRKKKANIYLSYLTTNHSEICNVGIYLGVYIFSCTFVN